MRVTLAVLLAVWVGLGTARAGEVRFFRMADRDAFLEGTLERVGIDNLGTLQLADRAERVREIGEPFVFAAARHPQGVVLGTGNAGRVLLLGRDGSLETLFEAPEPEVFAVWADDDGTVWAGTSPRGRVYRIRDGKAEAFFDPQSTYIWSLSRTTDGSLLVGTGTEGKLFRVGSDGSGTVLYDSEDTHVRSVKALADGGVLFGTAGEGLILRIDAAGQVRTLFDADQPEIVALAEGEDGECFAAALDSHASLVPSAPEKEDEEAEDGESVVVDAAAAVASGGGARSEILRIEESGLVESVAGFDEETVYALLWHRDRLWVGTGLEGKIYSLRDGEPILEKDVDERQVVALLADDPGPGIATTNAAAFYRMSSRTERSGRYVSPALDAGQISRFGALRWRGSKPGGTGLRFAVRTGMSSEPDRTWSAWSDPAGGDEIDLTSASPGRYLQWRAEFAAADGRSPRLSEVEISYRQRNLAPRIRGFTALDPGQVVVPANFNPASQVYEPAHPNRDGIFTTLEPSSVREDRRTKTLWKVGYRTLRWEVDDPNDDDLEVRLDFRRDEGGADAGEWTPVADGLDGDSYSFDATVLPDGWYRFRLTVSDEPGNPDDGAETAEKVSEPVLIDHSVPELVEVDRNGRRWVVRVADSLSPLREAVVSFDASGWIPATVSDGLLDERNETLSVDVPDGGGLVLLRLTDAAFNAVTYDLGRGR